MRFLLSLLIVSAVFALKAQNMILPQPKFITVDTTHYVNFGKALFTYNDAATHRLIESLNTNSHGLEVHRFRNSPSSGIRINANLFLHPKYDKKELDYDNYTLDIQAEAIHIYYTNEASAYMAFQSLLQLLKTNAQKDILLPLTHINDYPDFEWRGLHLDCSRHFFSTQEIKRFLNTMAYYKFNKFHWHLTDDQGWRIELKKYPELTSVGAYRDSTKIGHFNEFEKGYEKQRYGGYYTQKQVQEIVAYAAKLHIEVIPEIEMPGHARAALAAFPELGCSQEQLPVASTWGIFNEVFCSKKQSLNFLKDVIEEVAPLFPSNYFHIGGDEAPSIQREHCKHCQKTIKKHHLHNEHEVQGYILKEMNAHLKKHNKTLIGWDEIIESGLPDNCAVMSWRGMQGGKQAAEQKHPVVMSPTTYCYFDYYQSDNPNEPLAIGGYLPLEKVYQFTPIPQDLDTQYHAYILGGQANLWTEYIADFDHLMYMTYPRALALAEKVWNKNAPSYEDFLHKVLFYQLPYLDTQNINYSKAIADANFVLSSDSMGTVAVHVENQNPLLPTITNFRNISTSSKTDFQLHLPEHKVQDTIYLSSFAEGMEDRKKEITLYLSQSTGCKIDSLTPPHPKFNNGGSFTLVNGVYGRRPWNGSDWLGFSGDTITVIFDLLEQRELTQLELSCLKAEGSWIYLPEHISVFGANDKNAFEEVESRAIHKEISEIPLANNYRYIKLVIAPKDKIPQGNEGAGQNPWTFIDEIIITWN
ncbi:hexosaminidase [Lishizhenia tianjinensis]|uniref:beta-N-acetylhexosaminidase n=1 Tax=Lishizhenia tianjinensis TaxID=477690 RepID=A0A1I6ZWX4_9FLAO|nr:beta-N-acetylhexosaminidase [Lishizhenia tianjinensis]SFT67117.1 hexosaminidase [Lishizhenia tianjinensis]